MAISEDKRAELLLAHYKDTYDNILYHWKTRNYLFAVALVLLALMALDLSYKSPAFSYGQGLISQLINAYLAKNLESNGKPFTVIDFAAIGSAIWFILLYVVIQYYQKSIFVDRQYRYISNMEEQICDIMGGDYVTREGKAYLSVKGVYKFGESDRRPLYLRAVGLLYTTVFPVMLLLVVTVKTLRENIWPSDIFDWFNIAVASAIIAYTIFYLKWVWKRK